MSMRSDKILIVDEQEISSPSLVAIAHGSRDRHHEADIEALMDNVRAQRPGLNAVVRYLEFSHPRADDLADLDDHMDVRPVAVPLLLSRGYHLFTDVVGVARERNFIVAKPLGPDSDLIDVMVDELSLADANLNSPIVLAAAGSTSELGRADVAMVSSMLESRLGVQVATGYVGSVGPHVSDVTLKFRRLGCEFSVCSYLLSRGRFHSSLLALGARFVTRPLSSNQSLASLVLRRYDQALAERVNHASNYLLHSRAS